MSEQRGTEVDGVTVSTNPDSENPPEPEPEGFREEQIKAEQERKLRLATQFDERSTEAKKRYKGVAELGDAPGSALADRGADARPKADTKSADTKSGSRRG